ncbi:MAG: Abi family protein [Bacillota bacterium]|nr:Abi family protein [Bacillota bacterium]
MDKSFKRFDEQINILKSRKLIIDNDEYVTDILSQINYYNVINGYKSIFLKRDLNGVLVSPEEFKQGTTFEELYSLYLMDFELKKTIFPVLLRFEKLLKTACAYFFSEKYTEDYSYLQMKNYSNDASNLTSVLKNIATLSNLVSSNNKNTGKPAIKHYIDEYSNVPLWVLINFLTLGNISYFYNSLENSLQSMIAKAFSTRYKKDYSSKEKIEAGEIIEILKISNYFRNIIAHDEVMYSFKIRKVSSTQKFKKYFNNDYNGETLFDLVMLLKLVLPKEEHNLLILEIKDIFSRFEKCFKTVKIEEVMELAGFKSNWEQI